MKKLDGMSKDLVRENVEKLKELFPSIVKEGKIDFEELELLLGENINRSKEHYSFVWNGKTEATKLAQKRSTGTLRPCVEDSVGKNGEKGVWDNETKNLYIEGDNLEVLKLLQASYNGRIKMIYIDPPYNTGHDFVYKDNFEDNLKNYKEITGQAQKSNAESDGRYHTNWLNMMYPRLKLARNLLSDDGAIFISIDDNEVSNIRKLCDEIFGENNFVAQFIWQKNFAPKNDNKYISFSHEYIIHYAKSKELYRRNLLPRTEKNNEGYNNPDNDPRGVWASGTMLATSFSESGVYEITSPNGTKHLPPAGRCWRYSQATLNELINDNRIYWGKDFSGVPRVKRFLSEMPDGIVPQTLLKYEDVGSGQEGTQNLKAIFDNKIVFDFPKPVRLIKRMIEIGTNDGDIILDFFGGSSTSAHAILEINAEKNTNRKFILVQLPEVITDGEALKLDKSTLCQVGEERICRAGDKIKAENPSATDLDIGFKVLKLDTSNLKKWNNEPTKDAEEVAKRIQISMDYMEEGRDEIDLVYEIMIKYGINLTNPVEKTANGKAYIVIGETYKLLICSAPNITLEDVEAFSNESVGTYLFADRCFTDDNLLINTQEILKAKNKDMRLF